MQTIIVVALTLVAVAYLGWQTWRTWKGGCASGGGGCGGGGCSKREEAPSGAVLIQPDDLLARARQRRLGEPK